MSEFGSGFEEIDHTADLSIKIWGESIESLFLAALNGLYHIAGVAFEDKPKPGIQHHHFEESDLESLLVSFLSELNYRMQFEYQYIKIINFEIEQFSMNIHFQIFQVVEFQKEIKAVTFHNLEIVRTEHGYSAIVVFDV
jgi:SHS2 domain-containing protein